jgi:hypothetical protein
MMNANPRTPHSTSPAANGKVGSQTPLPGPDRRPAVPPAGGADQQDDQTPYLRRMLRQPRFWIALLAVFAMNWLLVPWLFPEPQDRLTISYTFFKQQVIASDVVEITGRGDDIQGTFRRPLADPAPPAGQPPQTYHQVRDA